MARIGDCMGTRKNTGSWPLAAEKKAMTPADRQRKVAHRARIMAKREKFGFKKEHHLIVEKRMTTNILALQRELALPHNKDIYDYAQQGRDFGDCLGRIGVKLDIAFDGMYGPEQIDEICGVLTNSLKHRYEHVTQPHLRDPRLVNVEMIERASTVTLEEVTDSPIGTIAPDTGRFVVCDSCTQSFDCITGRECLAEKPKAVLVH